MSSSSGVFPDLDSLPQECNLARHNEFEGHRRGSTDQELCVAAVFGERAEIVPCLRQRETIQPIASQRHVSTKQSGAYKLQKITPGTC